MTIRFSVLGEPGRDNAVYAEVDSGQSIARFLFDCGEDCATRLRVGQLQTLDALLLSHFHMDHVSGFDGVFRHNYDRSHGFVIVGPPDTNRCITHRLQGFTWNLVSDAEGCVEIREAKPKGGYHATRRSTRSGFEQITGEEAIAGPVWSSKAATITASLLNHGCTSAGYLLREPERKNVNQERLRALGLRPGPWLQTLKSNAEVIEVDGEMRSGAELRSQLLEHTPGESLAYLTDFRPSGAERDALIAWLQNVDTLICENNYWDDDRDLAAKNHHLTSSEVAQLAHDSQARQLILFHLSDRYQRDQWRQQLDEVREIFPAADWPTEWQAMLRG